VAIERLDMLVDVDNADPGMERKFGTEYFRFGPGDEVGVLAGVL
jgi:hypothetical protein